MWQIQGNTINKRSRLMLRTPLIRPEAAAMKGADRPEADFLFLVIVVPFVSISWLQFTDASCTAEPGKKMPP